MGSVVEEGSTASAGTGQRRARRRLGWHSFARALGSTRSRLQYSYYRCQHRQPTVTLPSSAPSNGRAWLLSLRSARLGAAHPSRRVVSSLANSSSCVTRACFLYAVAFARERPSEPGGAITVDDALDRSLVGVVSSPLPVSTVGWNLHMYPRSRRRPQ